MSSGNHRGRLYSVLLMAADAVTVYAILCGALYVYYLCGARYTMHVALKLFYVPFIVVVINSFSRLYGGSLFYPGLGVNRVEELKRLTLGVAASYALLFSYLGVTHSMPRFSRLALIAGMLTTMLVLPLVRQVILPWLCRKLNVFRKRVLIVVSSGYDGASVTEEIESHPDLNIKVVGILNDSGTGPGVLGKLEDHAEVAAKYDIDYAVMCLQEADSPTSA